MRSEREVSIAIDTYSDMVLRLCGVYLKNDADAEDIFQTVFLKYTMNSPEFESEEHEKAWLVRVTKNACKDLLKSFFRSRTVSMEELVNEFAEDKDDNSYVMQALLSLPKKYREVIYLHYYEGYTAPEISKILGKNTNTVYTNLHKAKQLLRELLKEEA